jgi:signal transduction histidine kinase
MPHATPEDPVIVRRAPGDGASGQLADETQHAIARAKLDWECTADSLSQVVCLVDEQRRVVRVNRALESWRLGLVNEVTGRDVHMLLHPTDCPGSCTLAALLRNAWDCVRDEAAHEFEIFDPQLERAVSIAVRPIIGRAAGLRSAGHARAVMVVTDVTPLRVARLALESLNQSLEARVRQRTSELESANRGLQNEIARREAAEEALRLSRNELMILSQQLIQAQEKERRRIAQELHDSVGQSLSAIKYSLERTAELLRQGKHADSQPILARTIGRVRDTIKEIRSIAMDLRPSILDDLGVASALEWLSREFAETYAQIDVHANISACDAEVPARLTTTIFRCAQELLNNVAKHSRARHVSIALFRDPAGVSLMVCDDGIGLPPVDSSGSFGRGHGIRNLRERAQMTGGKMTLSQDHRGGTRARLDWPLATGDLQA